MRTIGLIGGMSFESSVIYYRLINEMIRERLGGLASAEIIMHSVNFAEIAAMQKAGDWDAAAERLARAGTGLSNAGAECLLLCTNTMHLVADKVAEKSAAPLLNIIDETSKTLLAAGCKKPLLLATRYTMEHGFYTERMKTHGLTPMVPDEASRTIVHSIIFDELCEGKVLDASRQKLLDIIAREKGNGADSVILGCTEICLILDHEKLELPGFDSTGIHARAAVDFALGQNEPLQSS